MEEKYDAYLIKNLGTITTAKNGELIIFELRLGAPDSGDYSDEHYAINYDSLQLLIAGLIEAVNMADALREKNPIHSGNQSSGFAFKLEKASIGPSSKDRLVHILELGVRGSEGGALRYRVRADRAQLEKLRDLLDWYLDTPDGQGQVRRPTH